MIKIVRHPDNTGESVPDDALLYFNATTNEYYIITDNLGNVLTWGSA